jgi:hypothetical protein
MLQLVFSHRSQPHLSPPPPPRPPPRHRRRDGSARACGGRRGPCGPCGPGAFRAGASRGRLPRSPASEHCRACGPAFGGALAWRPRLRLAQRRQRAQRLRQQLGAAAPVWRGFGFAAAAPQHRGPRRLQPERWAAQPRSPWPARAQAPGRLQGRSRPPRRRGSSGGPDSGAAGQWWAVPSARRPWAPAADTSLARRVACGEGTGGDRGFPPSRRTSRIVTAAATHASGYGGCAALAVGRPHRCVGLEGSRAMCTRASEPRALGRGLLSTSAGCGCEGARCGWHCLSDCQRGVV